MILAIALAGVILFMVTGLVWTACLMLVVGAGAELELRRRQSLDRVHGVLLAEDSTT